MSAATVLGPLLPLNRHDTCAVSDGCRVASWVAEKDPEDQNGQWYKGIQCIRTRTGGSVAGGCLQMGLTDVSEEKAGGLTLCLPRSFD